MYRLLESLPLPIVVVFFLAFIPANIYCFIKFRKDNPGHPFRFTFIPLIFAFPALLLHFLKEEYNVLSGFSTLINIFAAVIGVIFFVTGTVTTILSCKWGFVEPEKVENIKKGGILIFGGIGAAILMWFIF